MYDSFENTEVSQKIENTLSSWFRYQFAYVMATEYGYFLAISHRLGTPVDQDKSMTNASAHTTQPLAFSFICESCDISRPQTIKRPHRFTFFYPFLARLQYFLHRSLSPYSILPFPYPHIQTLIEHLLDTLRRRGDDHTFYNQKTHHLIKCKFYCSNQNKQDR
ncbi:hypothetical protein CSKR_202060 [Clonorchis sinensis]|uniref:Uncharacterized protein n=1 Tax=Clonorchis sinensis TaxID=79923 RepID=A0A8T1LX15_CLOSI|nr:hypothetical protein CSKR_202060 [Clonorchis sinensis]